MFYPLFLVLHTVPKKFGCLKWTRWLFQQSFKRPCVPCFQGNSLLILPSVIHIDFVFRSLAYKNYHGVPIYLEWAPKGTFSAPAVGTPVSQIPTANGRIHHNHQTSTTRTNTGI